MTAMRLKRYPSQSGGFALGKMGVGATLLNGWKNPYVTNGLVRQWDGEWNEAGGIHNSSLQGWVDLATGNFCPFSHSELTPTWGDAYYYNGAHNSESYFSASVPDLATTEGSTIEVVVKKIGYNRGTIFGGYLVSGGNNCNIEWMTGYACRAYYYGNPDVRSPDNTFPLDAILYFAATRSGNDYAISDGAQVIGSRTSTSRNLTAGNMNIGCDSRTTANCFVGNIYAIRVYSRCLTAQEIAANYAIDKERFNLP